MCELKEGPITWRALSEWFGLNPNTLSKHPETKEKKLKILSSFAEYHFEGKKLYIDKVLIKEYSKAYEIVEREFPKEWGNVINEDTRQLNIWQKQDKIDTCARVSSVIYDKNPEVNSQITKKTCKYYTGQVKVKFYGHNYLDDEGTLGRSRYVWVKPNGQGPLDAKELQLINECAAKAYGSIGEKIAFIDSAYHSGEITKEERDNAIGNIQTTNNYELFVNFVIDALGYFPDKNTQLIDKGYEW